MDASARRLCLVTGASAGIGAEIARQYAARGYDLALVARRGDRLRALASEVEARSGAHSLCVEADLADPGSVADVMAQLEGDGRPVSVLINNAGYGLSGSFAEGDWSRQAAQLQVMLTGVCELTHRVLPGMRREGFGRVLNVASVAGLMPGSAGDTLYAPIKSFVVKFSQGLHLEHLETGVHVSALCPGYTYSEFHDVNASREKLTAAMPRWMWLDTADVAAAGIAAVEANRPMSVPGLQYKVIAALGRLIPDSLALKAMSRRPGFLRD